MTRERTFLDTNIVSDRKLREKKIVQKIESVIGKTFKYCSAFIVSEHKRTFLLTMRFLWIIFEEKKDFYEVKKFIEDHKWKSDQEKDRYKKVLKWVSEDGNLSYDDIVLRLERLIFLYDEFFFGDISVLESEVYCPLATIKMSTTSEIMKIVPTCSLKCSLSEFLRNQRKKLIILRKEIENIQHMGLVAAALQRVINDFDQPDEGVCKTLADTTIILEAPDNHLICSNNVKDFQPICKALEKRFLPIRY